MSYLGYPYQIKQVSNIELEGDYIKIPQGTTTQRDNNIPIPESGMFRFNSTENTFEGYDGTEWGAIGSSGGIDLIDENGSTTTLSIQTFPFYSETGAFSPICLIDGNVPFVLADGTVTYLKVS